MICANNRHDFQPRTIHSVLKTLFKPRESTHKVHQKGVNPHKRYPDEYYKQVFISKKTDENVKFVQDVEKVSKKEAARLLIDAGWESYLTKKVEINRQERLRAKELNKRIGLTVFMREFMKYCHERGINLTANWTIKE